MKYSRDELRAAMRIYAVTDRRWLKDTDLPTVCRSILESGATFLQLREKDLRQDEFLREAEELQALCREYHVPFVVNDSVETALEMDADGVHVGQSDLRGRDLRAMLGVGKLLGISAGTVEQAVAAERAGADYIGVGAVFDTGTKADARMISQETLREITKSVSIPVVAIGGITLGNMEQLAGSGIDGIAVVSAIFAAENPAAATRALAEKVKRVI